MGLKKSTVLSIIALSFLLQDCSKNNSNNNTPVTPKTAVVSTFVGNANKISVDGTGTAASFTSLSAMTIDANGNLFAVDGLSGTIRKITSTGIVSTTVSNTPVNGVKNGLLLSIDGLALDGSGNIFITTFNGYIVKITATGTVTFVAGGGGARGDGTGAGAGFLIPIGIIADASGNNFYIADSSVGLIRKVTATGVVTTLAGNTKNSTIDGTGTAASFVTPFGICMDSKGNLFVTDEGDGRIRKITAAGVVTTFAGNGNKASVDGIGLAASFLLPQGIAIDASDNLYVADAGNRQVRMITPDAKVTTIAGLAGQIGYVDGSASVATFGGPSGIAVDKNGVIYVSDADNNVIRKIVFQ